MLKYIVGVVLIAVLATGAYYVREAMQEKETKEPITKPFDVEPQPTVATSTYATTTFSLVYPSDFSVDEQYAYQGVPNKPIPGVKFTVPSAMATGTNLSVDTGLSVESLPRAQTCTGDIYLLQNVRATQVIDNGVTYSLATTSDAAAGNRYEEYVYALKDSSPCTAVRYYIHSTALENYGTSTTIKEFDRNVLLQAFDEIRRSLKLGQ